jgi:hypothetical protein
VPSHEGILALKNISEGLDKNLNSSDMMFIDNEALFYCED